MFFVLSLVRKLNNVCLAGNTLNISKFSTCKAITSHVDFEAPSVKEIISPQNLFMEEDQNGMIRLNILIWMLLVLNTSGAQLTNCR